MLLDGSSCLGNDNSTECLVRVLLSILEQQRQANDEFNWDPVTFAFTVPIAIIAALFALTTIAQATVAASRGHRKSSRRAIGKWASNSTSSWSLSHFNFLYTVKTPILKIDTLVKQLERHREESNEFEHDQRLPESRSLLDTIWLLPRKILILLLRPRDESNLDTAASWPNLLETAGLSDIEFPDKALKESFADYLPDDLLAAPAYGQVGAIAVIMAATEPCSFNFTTNFEYPTIRGRSIRFDFRQHPSLGILGAFSKFGERTAEEKSLQLDRIATTLGYSRGIFDIGRRSFVFSCLAVPKLDISHMVTCGRMDAVFSRARVPASLPNWVSGSTKLKARVLPLLLLLESGAPERPPPIFPWSLVHNKDVLAALVLNSKFWPSSIHRNRSPVPSWRCEHPDSGRRALNHGQSFSRWEGRPPWSPQLVFLDEELLDACLERFGSHNRTSYSIEIDGDRREDILEHIRCIDEWLEKQDRDERLRRESVLYQTTLALLAAREMFDKRNSQEPPATESATAGFASFFSATMSQLSGFLKNFPLDTRPLSEDSETLTRFLEVCDRYRDDLHALGTKLFKVYAQHQASGIETFDLLKRLQDLVSQWEQQPGKDYSTKVVDHIDDVIILRCMMVALLYGTSFDNTPLQRSGVWDHVVPII